MKSSAPAALAPSDLTSLGLLREVADNIRRLDQAAPNDAAFRSGTLHAITELLPSPAVPLDWTPSRLAPGSAPAAAAGMIYGHLAWHPGPATALFTRLARAPAAVTVICAAYRALDDDEAADLQAAPGAPAYDREAIMTAGTVDVAWTRLILIRDRIPGEAWAAIQGGQPAGDALAPYGVRRTRRDVTLDRDAPAVTAAADLMLGDTPIGTAEEHVTPEFCAHVARLAG